MISIVRYEEYTGWILLIIDTCYSDLQVLIFCVQLVKRSSFSYYKQYIQIAMIYKHLRLPAAWTYFFSASQSLIAFNKIYPRLRAHVHVYETFFCAWIYKDSEIGVLTLTQRGRGEQFSNKETAVGNW
jgi:hypothetical protein